MEPKIQADASNEWGDIAKQAMGIVKGFSEQEKKSDFSKTLADIDRRIAEMKALKLQTGEATARAPLTATDPSSVEGDVPDSYMMANSKFESGDNPNAVNKLSGASGRYQFMPSTWQGLIKEAPHLQLTPEGIKDDAQQNRAMRYYTTKSVDALKPVLGRQPTGGELYLAHLLGHSGGPSLIKRQDEALTEALAPIIISSNPFLKRYKTGRDLIADLNKKFGGG